MAVLGLCCCVGFCLVLVSGGYSPLVVNGLLIAVASFAVEQRLNSCGIWVSLPHGMWDLHRLGVKFVSPELAGRFFTTKPPGKPPKVKAENILELRRLRYTFCFLKSPFLFNCNHIPLAF